MEVLEENSSESTTKQNLLEQTKIDITGNVRGIKKNKELIWLTIEGRKKYHRENILCLKIYNKRLVVRENKATWIYKFI